MEKKENTLSNQIRDRDMMEARIVAMTNEISALGARLKVSSDLSMGTCHMLNSAIFVGIGREAC